MKSHISEGGIITLFSQIPNPNIKVQVIYLARVNSTTFIRVTDSRNLSPIIVALKLQENFIVGDILLIKKVQFQYPGSIKDNDCLPFLDYDLNFLQIIEYKVLEQRDKVDVLHNHKSNNDYWDSISHLKNYLIRNEGASDSYFFEMEKRKKLLQPDCNLLRERGNELYKKQQYLKAIIHYEMAKHKDGYDCRVWNNSSIAYLVNSEFQKARRDALIALKLDPFSTKAFYRAGQAISSCGDHKAALEIIEAGLYICDKKEELLPLRVTVQAALTKAIREKEIAKEEKENNANAVNTTTVSASKKKDSNEKNKNDNNNTSTKKKNNQNYKKYDFDGFTNEDKQISTDESSQNGHVSKQDYNISNARKNSKAKESPVRKHKDSESSSKSDSKSSSSSSSSVDAKSEETTIISLTIGARMLYDTNQIPNAQNLFHCIIENPISVSIFDKKELEILKFLLVVCKIKNNSEPLENVKSSLTSLVKKDIFPYPAALHFWFAKLYEQYDQQDKVIHHGNMVGTLLKNNNGKFNLCWPRTQDPISETLPKVLKKWYKEATWRPAPLSKCRHTDCLTVQGHDFATQEIYTSDADFRGFVEIECEELCSIVYHPCCWKIIKETDDGTIQKKLDKDFLLLDCFTPDCSGKICSVRIFDESSQLKNETVKDKKDKKSNNLVKPKKKKDKKKAVPQNNRYNKKTNTELDDIKINDKIQIVIEETVPSNSSKSSSEQVNFNSSDYKVLKHIDDDNEFQGQKKGKAKPRKKKKNKLTSIDIVPDETLDSVINNEYLSRLKALRSQREEMENGNVQINTEDPLSNLKYLPDCILDPDKPFYLPRHLQENPALLETVLRNKMITASSSDIKQDQINSLLEFMYDLLKAQNPMNVNDNRIRDYISEYFPPNAVAYVNKCGGIRNFLLQSFRFAIIDDIICVQEQVVAAQNVAVQNIRNKFKNAKYIISDGHKAAKYSHLIDDAKSTCSTTSSASNVLGQDQNPVLPVKGDYSASATPYKSAALAPPAPKEPASQNKQQPVGALPKKKEVKKPKLKTMDMDAFEDVGAEDMGKLFSSSTSKNSNEDKRGGVDSASTFLSDSEENVNNTLPKAKEATMGELKESLHILQNELSLRNQEINKAKEEIKTISAQNTELKDRMSQMKTKSNVEITSLKKSNEDALESTKAAESTFESYKSKKDSELRKVVNEKTKLQEEVNTYVMKMKSIEMSMDQLNTGKHQHEEELKQKSNKLAKQHNEIGQYKETVRKLDEKAKLAELKYITTKKEFIKTLLETSKRRLMAEANKMRDLLPESSEFTQPTKNILTNYIAEYEDTINKISNSLKSVNNDSDRFVELIKSGHGLNALPPGDLQKPSVPDLTIVNLLHVGKTLPSKFNESQSNHHTSFLNTGTSSFPTNSSNISSQIGALASGRSTFSFGQLGVGASASKLSSADPMCTSNKPPSTSENSFGISTSSLGHLSGTSSINSPSRSTAPSAFSLGMNSPFNTEGISSRYSGNSLLNGASAMNFQDDLTNTDSTDSSPISMPPMSNLGSASSDLQSAFSMGNKSAMEQQNQLFVGQLPWNIKEEHLRALFSKYGDVVATAVHDKGHTPDGKPVPKCGFVTFRTQQQRDFALRSGPMSFGNHNLNIQAKEIKRPSKLPVGLNPQTGGGTSAFGLHSLLEASKNCSTPKTIGTPTTPTISNPKFSSMQASATNIGAIGQPKVVRPIPRPGSSSMLGLGALTSSASALPLPSTSAKDDAYTKSASYKKLLEECKQKFGNDYPEVNIHKAIKDVREHNKNSLSGLALDTILDQIESQLKLQKMRMQQKAASSAAPWATLSKPVATDWRGVKNIGEEECIICMESLNNAPTMALQCRHVFHIKCIKSWLSHKSDCPICRKFALSADEFPSLSSH